MVKFEGYTLGEIKSMTVTDLHDNIMCKLDRMFPVESVQREETQLCDRNGNVIRTVYRNITPSVERARRIMTNKSYSCRSCGAPVQEFQRQCPYCESFITWE